MNQVRLAILTSFFLSFAALHAHSGEWPSKPVEIIAPMGAGGDTDFNARMFSQYLPGLIGGNFVVSNITGNGGATGSRKVKEAKPDGYTVLFSHPAFVVNKLSGAASYGFESFDFVCVAAMAPGICVTVRADTGFKTIKDLIEYSQKHPYELTIAAQTGATTHATALLLEKAGAQLTVVDSGSSSDRVAALLGGHVDVIANPYGNIKDYVKEGEFVVLGLDGPNDLPEIGLQSIVSQGYDISLPFYYFFAFPKGTDPKIVEKFSLAVKEIVENNPEYAEKIAAAYLQKPIYFDSKEGLDKMLEVEKGLSVLDFQK